MKTAINALLSLAVGAVCVWLVVRNMDGPAVLAALRALSASAVAVYLVTLAVTHFFRAWRWDFLLRPLGASLPLRRLLPISSVGFMAILALPVRLGEFVRPYYVKRDTGLRMSAALGTVAVERIVDGLLISSLFFVSYLMSEGPGYPGELRVAAWLSLAVFVAATAFLAFALRWPDATIGLALRLSLLRALAPRLAERVGDKLRALISGFRVLGDLRNLLPFLVQSVCYWGANGFGMWLLARAMGLPIPLFGAYAVMALTGVMISLPNSPGLVGQFHYGIILGLSAYLARDVVGAKGIAYAVVLHASQVVWYVGVGLLSLPFAGGGLGGAVRASQEAAHEDAQPSAAE